MVSPADGTTLIAVVGSTSSGKSSVGFKLAKALNGEIVSVDSRNVYKGMDIGTAKPTETQQLAIRHYCVDIVLPDVNFTAADFKLASQQAIMEIRSRGKIPILVGGSGLYMDSALFDFELAPANPVLRAELEAMDLVSLQARASESGIVVSAQTLQNPRHLRRLVERGGVTPGRQHDLPAGVLIVGLCPPRDVLLGTITVRVEQMFADGLEQEVQHMARQYGWEAPGMASIGYREFRQYMDGHQTLEQVRTAIIRDTMHYAKRQMTWFKRNPFIQWFAAPDDAYDFIVQCVQK